MCLTAPVTRITFNFRPGIRTFKVIRDFDGPTLVGPVYADIQPWKSSVGISNVLPGEYDHKYFWSRSKTYHKEKHHNGHGLYAKFTVCYDSIKITSIRTACVEAQRKLRLIYKSSFDDSQQLVAAVYLDGRGYLSCSGEEGAAETAIIHTVYYSSCYKMGKTIARLRKVYPFVNFIRVAQ